MEKRLFTSECVTCGHPDKVADSISDAILDACLAQDPGSRVACETMVTTNFCVICGEITTKAVVDYAAVARDVIRKIGYVHADTGFEADSVEILCKIHTSRAVTRREGSNPSFSAKTKKTSDRVSFLLYATHKNAYSVFICP